MLPGNPLKPGTLHFQSDDVLNDYEECITSIGNAIDKYNSASEYSVLGFGAKFGDGVVRHLFQCGQSPTVKGVEGILDAYRSVFRSGGIYMSGPTVFVKAIQAAAIKARKYVSEKSSSSSLLVAKRENLALSPFLPIFGTETSRRQAILRLANCYGWNHG